MGATARQAVKAAKEISVCAPNIKLQLGGTCFLVNVTDQPVRLPKTSTEYRMIRWAEIAYDHMETFMYFGAPA